MNKIHFEDIYNKYYKVLYYYALKIVKESEVAEDILQDIFSEIWLRRHEIDKNLSIKSYLYTLVRNRSFDHLKSSYKKTKTFDSTDAYLEEVLYSILSTDDYINTKELKSELDIAINNLSERCKKVYLLSRETDLKNREIAEKLNIHIKTVEKHITKALLDIKTHLEKIGYLSILLFFFNQ